MIQEEITKWEMDNFDLVIGWIIEYFVSYDKITFMMMDKSEIIFIRK